MSTPNFHPGQYVEHVNIGWFGRVTRVEGRHAYVVWDGFSTKVADKEPFELLRPVSRARVQQRRAVSRSQSELAARYGKHLDDRLRARRANPASLSRTVSTLKGKVAALASIHKLPSLRCNPDHGLEWVRISYAYPSSSHARAIGKGKEGAWVATALKTGRKHPVPFGGGWPTSAEAVAWARRTFPGFIERADRHETRFTKPGAMRSNPSSGPVDSHAARELQLFIENDGDLYRQQMEPIQKNLVRKLVKGTYDHKQAPKLWLYLVDNGARKYNKEFGSGDGVGSFNLNTRKVVAEALAEEFLSNYRNGEYSHLIPEKQRAQSARRSNPRGRRRAMPTAPRLSPSEALHAQRNRSSLYRMLKKLRVPIDHYETDLYFPVTDVTRKLLSRYPLFKSNSKTFVAESEPLKGKLWYEVPFAYDPGWERRRR